MNMNESLLNKLKQIKSLTEAADPMEFEDDIEFSNDVDTPEYGESEITAGDTYNIGYDTYTWVKACGEPNPNNDLQVWEATSEDGDTVYFTVDTQSNEVMSRPIDTLEEAQTKAGIEGSDTANNEPTSVYLSLYHKEVPITIVDSEDELPENADYKSTDFTEMLDIYRTKKGDFYGIRVPDAEQPEISEGNNDELVEESLTETIGQSPEEAELEYEFDLDAAKKEIEDLGPEVQEALKEYLADGHDMVDVLLSDEGREEFVKWLKETKGIELDPEVQDSFTKYQTPETEVPDPIENHKTDFLMDELKGVPEIYDLLIESLPDWEYWVTQTNADTNDGSKYPVLVIKFTNLDKDFYHTLQQKCVENGHYDVYSDGASTIFIYPYDQDTNESLTEELAIQLVAPAEETPVANVECPACTDACVSETATKVMAAYQNANKWMDILKEFLFTDLGCVFFSSYIHNLAHTMPSRFDSFGDILHTIDMRIPYPETAYIPKEPNNVDDVFALTFAILDDIKKSLNEFIDCTDKKYHGMACAAEDLLNDIEGEYVPLYKMEKSWKSYNGDHIRWDKWVGQYTKERDNLVESVNEVIDRNYAFRSGAEAREFFDALYARGRKEAGNSAEVEKARPAYYEVIKLLNVPVNSDSNVMAKAYDELTDQKIKTQITKLARTATTWDRHGRDVAASYDESLAEDTVKTKDGEWTNKGNEGTHGKFKTKKEADAQRRAMYANGYTG